MLSVTGWMQKRSRITALAVLLSAAIGICSDRFIGGQIAEYAGMVQAHVLIAYITLWIDSLLAGPYGLRTAIIMERPPIAIIRILLFTVISALGTYVTAKVIADGIFQYWLTH